MTSPDHEAIDFEVPDELAGTRLDVVLAGKLHASRSRVAGWIDAGDVRVDGRTGARGTRLRPGQRVTVARPAPQATLPAPALPPIRYEDEHLLVVAKPAGMVVHPGAGHPAGTLVDALQAAGVPLAPAGGEQRPGIVHRLDRDTSGLLLVAKTDAAHTGLVAALAGRKVDRRYLALVAGVPQAPRGRIEAPLGRDPRARERFAVVEGGKEAVTRYRTLSVGAVPMERPGRGALALLACRLETGRTHQIRVHVAALGHPIVGDGTYGGSTLLADALGLTRPFLHATVLRLAHPISGAPLDVTEPLPAPLPAALGAAGIPQPDLADL